MRHAPRVLVKNIALVTRQTFAMIFAVILAVVVTPAAAESAGSTSDTHCDTAATGNPDTLQATLRLVAGRQSAAVIHHGQADCLLRTGRYTVFEATAGRAQLIERLPVVDSRAHRGPASTRSASLAPANDGIKLWYRNRYQFKRVDPRE